MKPADADTSPAAASAAFVAFLSRFHDQCANTIQDPSFLFFNYGLADRDDAYSWVRPDDRPYRYHLNLVRRMTEGVDLNKKTVLDVSSGRGGNCYYLLHYSSASGICGVDRCEPYVQFSRHTLSDHRLSVLCADALRLPLRNASFDVVLNVQSSHCYGDFGLFLREMQRVLRPGGTLAYADAWNLDMFPIDWNERRKQMAESGFEIVRQSDVATNVSEAMSQDDGFGPMFLKTASRFDEELFVSVSAGLQQIQCSLAEHRAAYWIYQLVKRGPVHELAT